MKNRIRLVVTFEANYAGDELAPESTRVNDEVVLEVPYLDEKYVVIPKVLEGVTSKVIERHREAVFAWREAEAAKKKARDERRKMLALWPDEDEARDGSSVGQTDEKVDLPGEVEAEPEPLMGADELSNAGEEEDGLNDAGSNEEPLTETKADVDPTALAAVGVDMPVGYRAVTTAVGQYRWRREWAAGLVEEGEPVDTLNDMIDDAWAHVRGADYRKSHTPPDLAAAGYWIEFRPALDHGQIPQWLWARDMDGGGREHGAPWSTKDAAIEDARRLIAAGYGVTAA